MRSEKGYEELDSLYRSPNTARVIKFRRLSWTGRVARMDEVSNAFNISTGKPTGNMHFSVKYFFGNGNSQLDFLCAVTISSKVLKMIKLF